MSEFTLDDLLAVLRECAGEAVVPVAADDVLDTPFPVLGYDSLALLEAAAVVARRVGSPLLVEETASEAETPRQFLDQVNASMAEAA